MTETEPGIIALMWLGITVYVIFPIILIIVAICLKAYARNKGIDMSISGDIYTSDDTIPCDKHEDNYAPYQDPRSLADKFDSRFTNIFKNPWDGIL